MTRYCIVCGNSIPDTKRSDAQTCSDRCRIEKSKRSAAPPVASNKEPEESLPVLLTPVILHEQTPSQAQLTAQHQQLLHEIEQLKAVIKQQEQQLYEVWQELETVVKPRYDQTEIDLRQKREKLSRYQTLLKMSDVDFYNTCGLFSDYLPATYFTQDEAKLPFYDSLLFFRRTQNMESARKELQNGLKSLQEQVNEREMTMVSLQSEINQLESYHKPLMQLVRLNKRRLMLLESAFYGRSIPKMSSKPSQRKQRALPPAPKTRIVSGGELMHASLAEPVLLPGRLGAFLGRVERHRFFLALTGDAGSGKSELSFRLARIFTAKGLRVMYFSLEMGINEDVQVRVKRYGLSEGFYLRDEGKLADVKKEAARYDAIFVDSFGKLEAEADEIDQLRNQFPHTFFIFIFQKTTTGTIRGGSKVIFDCTASIDLVKDERGRRVATMTKSRYGTQGWQYLPMEDQVIRPAT